MKIGKTILRAHLCLWFHPHKQHTLSVVLHHHIDLPILLKNTINVHNVLLILPTLYFQAFDEFIQIMLDFSFAYYF